MGPNGDQPDCRLLVRIAAGRQMRCQTLPVVYDSVGKENPHGIARLPAASRPDGRLRPISGAIGPVNLGIFAQNGSPFFTRPTLNTYVAKRTDLLAMAKDLFDVVLSGAVKIEIKADVAQQ